MKKIEVDEELYRYIASHTQHIGESATDILRRMLKFTAGQEIAARQVLPQNDTLAVKTSPSMQHSVRTLRKLLLSDEYAQQQRTVNRFILVLSTLYAMDANAFTEAAHSLHGRKRVYFADNQHILLQNGTHTKPKHVPGTPYWVITNTNTGRKCSMIKHIMLSMQFPGELTEKVCGTL